MNAVTDYAGGEAMRGTSPNRLAAAPPTYPLPDGDVQAAVVGNVYGRIGWLLTSGTGALDWVPDVLGADEPVLQAWVLAQIRAAFAAGVDRDGAVALVAAALDVGQAVPVQPATLRAGALPS